MTTVNDDETATGTPGTPATSRRRLLGSVGAAGVAGYHDGIGGDGVPDAGLLSVAWQADPLRGFVPVRRKLARADGLSRFLRHEASALFAVPGGAAPGEYVGQRLLEG
jgi:dye decolorizing peroxidase